jgi:integrase/recombinase XerD
LVTRSQNLELQQKEVSLHVLRHSIATHLIEEGLALEKVRDFLGHYHLETTEIYTHISQQQINSLQ